MASNLFKLSRYPYTVETLLTHTPRWRVQPMGYVRLWVIRMWFGWNFWFGGPPRVWVIGDYGLSEVWVMGVSTVIPAHRLAQQGGYLPVANDACLVHYMCTCRPGFAPQRTLLSSECLDTMYRSVGKRHFKYFQIIWKMAGESDPQSCWDMWRSEPLDVRVP